MRNSRLESQILASVDELVQCAIAVGLKEGEEREEAIARGVELVRLMGDLLVEALEGRTQHMRALLEQLVAQRLPDRKILQSFGTFSRDLEEIIDRGIAAYRAGLTTPPQASPREEPAGAGESGPAEEGEAVTGEGEDGEDETYDLLESAQEEVEEAPAAEETGPSAPLPSADAEPSSPPEPGSWRNLRLALERAYPGEEIKENVAVRGGKLAYFLPRLGLGFEIGTWPPDWRKDFFFRQAGIEVVKVAAEELRNPFTLAHKLRRMRPFLARNR
ncbi:MAG: hypothetical protein IMW96_11275 [Thermoanaerobacteraceae bacterium]|nr:hypothetical protein [Thermoanaerobacteraceae bacterium]